MDKEYDDDLTVDDFYDPDLELQQQIDAENVLTEDDYGDYSDDMLIQDIGDLF